MALRNLTAAIARVTMQPPQTIERILTRAYRTQKPWEWQPTGGLVPDQAAMLARLRKSSATQLRPVARAFATTAAASPKRFRVLSTMLGTAAIPPAVLDLLALYGDASPLAQIGRRKPSLRTLRERARTRYAKLHKEWRLDLRYVIYWSCTAAERALAVSLFAILAAPCANDEEIIRLAVAHTGPGAEGYAALLACAAHLRDVHKLRPPKHLYRKGWDGGLKEKAQGTYEVLLLALTFAPAFVPELMTTLFAQSWAPKHMPAVWLALAPHFEDRVERGEGPRLVASARFGETMFSYSRGKVRTKPVRRAR